jgi:hypothetical protein
VKEFLACKITHEQIELGSCPWCELRGDAVETGARVWNERLLELGCLNESSDIRRISSANVVQFDVPFELGIQLFQLVYRSPFFDENSALDVMALGRRLPAQIFLLAEHSPDEVASDPVLAAAVLSHTFCKKLISARAKMVHHEILMRSILYYPRSIFHALPEATFYSDSEADSYRAGLKLWKQQVAMYSGDLQIAANAQNYKRFEL